MREARRLPERLGDNRGGWETTEEATGMAATTVTANEVTGCTKDDDKDEARQRRQRR